MLATNVIDMEFHRFLRRVGAAREHKLYRIRQALKRARAKKEV